MRFMDELFYHDEQNFTPINRSSLLDLFDEDAEHDWFAAFTADLDKLEAN